MSRNEKEPWELSIPEYISEAKEHLGFIGIFWYNDDKRKLMSIKEDLSEMIIPLNKQRDPEYYIIGNHAHFTSWTSKISKENGDVDYKYYPRGRVVYFQHSREFKIYSDKCIPSDVIGKIKELFLTGSNADVINEQGYDDEKDKLAKIGHYTCHRCKNENKEE